MNVHNQNQQDVNLIWLEIKKAAPYINKAGGSYSISL